MPRVSRDTLIERAEVIIRENPAVGRRVIAKELRAEYGVALRDAVILKLQRAIYPRPFQAVEAQRAKRLQGEGYSPFEVKQLKTLAFSKTTFMEIERRHRAKEHKVFLGDLKAQGYTKKQSERLWRANVRDKYINAEQVLEDGKPDPWQMFRDVRAESIRSGKWKATPRYKGLSHRKRTVAGKLRQLDKGRIKAQKERYRERKKRTANKN